MLGRKSEFQAHVKAVSPSVICVHCFIHQFALAAKLLSPNLKTNLNLIVKMVNCIMTSALNSCLFKVICENIGLEYTSLLFHMEVSWPSRGNTVMRLFVLRKLYSSPLKVLEKTSSKSFSTSKQKITNFRRRKLYSSPYLPVRYFWSHESLQLLSLGA